MRPFILLPTLACLILIVAHRVRGFSSGAPEESCDSLTVNHTHVGSPAPGVGCDATCRQTRQLRLIGSSADNFTYNCSETYHLQLIKTDPGDPFLNGYMVAPREDTGTPLDGNVSYVGSWENGADIKLLCNKSAVTQSRALVATTTVNMTWKAPMYGFTNVAFWFVIVPSTAFYYLPVKSLTATPNPETCSCPPGQCQWQNDTVFSCVRTPCISDIRVQNRSVTTITFSWTVPAPGLDYNIQICQENASTCLPRVTCTDCKSHEGVGLLPNTNYTITVDGVSHLSGEECISQGCTSNTATAKTDCTCAASSNNCEDRGEILSACAGITVGAAVGCLALALLSNLATFLCTRRWYKKKSSPPSPNDKSVYYETVHSDSVQMQLSPAYESVDLVQ